MLQCKYKQYEIVLFVRIPLTSVRLKDCLMRSRTRATLVHKSKLICLEVHCHSLLVGMVMDTFTD